MKKLSSYRMQSYQKDFTPQPPPSRQSTLFNILNTNLRANGQRGTPTYHKINVCSPHDYRFTNLPRRGNTFTTAWYTVYHGLVHRLPRRGNQSGKPLAASYRHFPYIPSAVTTPPKTLISNLFPGDTLIQPITHVTR